MKLRKQSVDFPTNFSGQRSRQDSGSKMQIFLKISEKLSMSTKNCASLWILFIILQLSMPCDTSALQNVDDFQFRTNSLERTDDVDKTPPFEATDDNTRENIHLYARVGHHFNRSLRQEIMNVDSDLLPDHQQIKVCVCVTVY